MLASIISRAPEACGQLANVIAVTLSEERGGRGLFPHADSVHEFLEVRDSVHTD